MNPETVFFPLLLTAKTCAVSLLLFLLLAVPLSYWLAGKRGIFAKAVELFVTLPLVFPPIALGYMLLVVLGRNLDRTVPGNFRTEDGVFSDGRNSCRICGWTTARRQTSSSSI